MAKAMGCRQGETLAIDVKLPNAADGSMPSVTSAEWFLLRGDYDGAIVVARKPTTIVTQTISGIDYRVAQINLATSDTATAPVGDLFQFLRIHYADGRVKDVEEGPFTVSYSP